jgi:urease beta subunit
MASFTKAFNRLRSRWMQQFFAKPVSSLEAYIPSRRGVRPLVELLERRQLLTAVYPEIDLRGNNQSIADGDASPAVADLTDFGNADIVSGMVTRTFTIANTGAGALNLTGRKKVAVSGTEASDFTVVAQPVASIAALTGKTTFQVRFDPSASGVRAATLTIYNDDDNENPYTFDIQGTGTTAPEIEVRGNGLAIVSGDITPTTADRTDFGVVEVSAGSFTQTFTIKNLGSGTLNLSGVPLVAVSGTNAADFTLVVLPSAVVAPGQTTFQITFDPSAAGMRVATLTIANDDANEGTYNYAIKGTGVLLPEIDVKGLGNSIATGDTTPAVADDTDFGSLDISAAAVTHTFTIDNLGSATLNLTGTTIIRISGTNAADFTVSDSPAATVAGSGSDTFDIDFNPSATGTRTAIITIANNDSNENPYVFTIQGTGTAAPEIDIQGLGNSITSGDTTPSVPDDTDFGNVELNFGTATHTFTILNTGSGALTLSGTPYVDISGTNPGDFSVVAQPAATVAAGGNRTFQLVFNPTASGARTATITIVSDDTSEGTYTFDITGTATTEPEMDISGNSVSITSGDATPSVTDDTDFGSVDITGGTAAYTFTITNSGSAVLNLTAGGNHITVGGANAADFSVTVTPGTPVAADGDTTTFEITFNPSAAGLRVATISIANDDTDEGPYTFSIQGTGVANVEIDLQGLGVSIADNDITPDVADDTDFGSVAVNGTSVTHVYAILNTKTEALNLTGSPVVLIDGTYVDDFSISFDPDISVGGTPVAQEDTFTPTIVEIGDVFTLTATVGGATASVSFTSTAGTVAEVAAALMAAWNSSTDGLMTGITASGGVTEVVLTADVAGTAFLVTGTATDGGGADTQTLDRVASTPNAGGTLIAITFSPTGEGLRTATVTIINDDSDEGNYTFDIQGTGTVASEIDLYGNDTAIADGDTTPAVGDFTDFGNVETDAGTLSRTFFIVNNGTGPLTLGGSPLVAISGADLADFVVTTDPASTVEPGGSTFFVITFNPGSSGAKVATVTIASDDGDEGTYNFDLAGNGSTAPEIEVVGRGMSIADGDTTPSINDDTDFGGVELNTGSVVYTFTINNLGTAALTLGGTPLVAVSGAHAANFVVTTDPGDPVAAGTSTTFVITFNPSATGLRTATVTIANNDGDEGTFNFDIQGTGLSVPEMDVLGNSVSIASGDAIPRPGDLTDFGDSDIGGTTVMRTFTIKNLGDGILNLTGTPHVVISGTDASDFIVITQPADTVAANNGTSTFSIRFAATATGFRTALATIANDDSDEGTYTFAIAGNGVATPEIDIQATGASIASGDNTPASADGTNVGNADVASGTVTQTFTIRNLGAGVLNLTGSTLVSIDGLHASDFTVVTEPSSNLAAGASTTFQITFDPSAAGTRLARLVIETDDADESSYTFSIAGVGLVSPEIDVKGNSVSIADGDAVASTADYTDFGSVEVNNGTLTRTFTIYNTGSNVLRLVGSPRIALSGANAADFSVVAQPTARIAALSGSVSFQIVFNPSATGARAATVTILNNDGNEGTYDFAIAGTGTSVPVMDVQGNSVTIADGDATPSASDHSDFGSTDIAGGTVTRTYTIYNNGSAALNLTGTTRAVVGGTNAADFSVTVQPPASIAAGANATFQVRFDPSAAGSRTATISIANNDTGTGKNPYNFSIQGTGGTSPEIDVTGNTVSIADGDATPAGADHTDFGNVEINNGTLTRTFTVKNTGSGALALSGSPLVAISGTNAADFTVTTLPAASVAATTGSTTFQVRFDPGAAGARTATITIANSDTNEGTYDFAIQGTGTTAPDMQVLGNSTVVSDGDTSPSSTDHTDFGSVAINGGNLTRTFTVRNTGSSALTLSGTPKVAVGGANAADYTVTVQPGSPVTADGGTTTFQVKFTPSGAGSRVATLSIANDDAQTGKNPYNFSISGLGVAAPEVDVQGNTVSIADGDTTPAGADHTDFGSTDLVSAGITRTFTIKNTGSATMTISGSPLVRLSGANAADFAVIVLPSASVASATGSTTFQVRFRPLDVGVRTAVVTFTNTDGDEGTYNFTIQGTGTAAPEIDVQGNATSIADGDATPSSTDHSDFGNAEINQGTVVRTFTIRNTGSDVLNLTGSPRVAIGGANAGDFRILDMPRSSVAASGTATFTVEFNPSAAGVRTATLTIDNDDTNEGTYDFTIQGTGVLAPEIEVTGNSQSITSGDLTPSTADFTNFGSVSAASGTITKTFTILNSGSANLTITSLVLGGTNAADYTVLLAPTSPVVANGGTTTFQIRFNPSVVGVRIALVTITTNDSDEGTFTFRIQGTGT